MVRSSVGLPVSLSLGVKLVRRYRMANCPLSADTCSPQYPIDFEKAIALTIEPALVAIAMTASDQDDFKEQGLSPCLGMSWKVGLGASVALNLFDFAKYPLGKFDLGYVCCSCSRKCGCDLHPALRPPLAKGCEVLYTAQKAAETTPPPTQAVDVPVVTVPKFTGTLPTDTSPYCTDPGAGTCACSVSGDGLTLTCTYTDDKRAGGGMGTFTSPCKGSGSAFLRGGVGGRGYIQAVQMTRSPAYETTGEIKIGGAT